MHTLNLEMTWQGHSSAGAAGVMPPPPPCLLQSPWAKHRLPANSRGLLPSLTSLWREQEENFPFRLNVLSSWHPIFQQSKEAIQSWESAVCHFLVCRWVFLLSLLLFHCTETTNIKRPVELLSLDWTADDVWHCWTWFHILCSEQPLYIFVYKFFLHAWE